MSQPKLAKGFTCECGKEHFFAPYVYAHWDIPLRHVCDGCGAKKLVLRGNVRPEQPPRAGENYR